MHLITSHSIIHRFNTEDDVVIENAIVEDDLVVRTLTYTPINITFKNVEFRGRVTLKNIKISSLLKFERCILSAPLLMGTVELADLQFTKTTFHDDIIINRVPGLKKVLFRDGEYYGNVAADLSSSQASLEINGGSYHKKVGFLYQDYVPQMRNIAGDVVISDANFEDVVSIKSRGGEIHWAFLNKVRIRFSHRMKGAIVLRWMKIGEAAISGINAYANFILKDIAIHRFNIKDFLNESSMLWHNLTTIDPADLSVLGAGYDVNSSLELINSDIGKTTMYSFCFTDFKKVYLVNSNISDISTSHVTWPERKEWLAWVRSATTHGLARYTVFEDIFRQLKIAMTKNNNMSGMATYKSLEMEMRHRSLRSKNLLRAFNEQFIYWSSKSNDYGTNWVKPIGLLIVLSFALYIPIAIADSAYLTYTLPHSFNDITVTIKEVFWNKISIWLRLLSPIHSVSDLCPGIEAKGNAVVVAAHTIDTMITILTSYLYYQIISAFRKYTK